MVIFQFTSTGELYCTVHLRFKKHVSFTSHAFLLQNVACVSFLKQSLKLWFAYDDHRPANVKRAELILQALCRFTYVTAHSTTLPSLYIRRSLFSNPSVASPTSQLIL